MARTFVTNSRGTAAVEITTDDTDGTTRAQCDACWWDTDGTGLASIADVHQEAQIHIDGHHP